MQTFIELLKDHALIPAAANALCAITAVPDPQPRRAHDALRRFARLLDAHLRAEERFLTQVRDDDDREFAALAIAHGKGIPAACHAVGRLCRPVG